MDAWRAWSHILWYCNLQVRSAMFSLEEIAQTLLMAWKDKRISRSDHNSWLIYAENKDTANSLLNSSCHYMWYNCLWGCQGWIFKVYNTTPTELYYKASTPVWKYSSCSWSHTVQRRKGIFILSYKTWNCSHSWAGFPELKQLSNFCWWH